MSNMIQWSENRELTVQFFQRLASLSVVILTETSAEIRFDASIVFVTICMRMFLVNKDLYFEILRNLSPSKQEALRSNMVVVLSSSEWCSRGDRFVEFINKSLEQFH